MILFKGIGMALFCGFVALGGGCASKQPDPSATHAAHAQGSLTSQVSPPEVSRDTSSGGAKGSVNASGMEPYGAYALDGPDLPVVGDFAGTPLQGTLQRKGMVGMGRLKLYSPDNVLICESIIKTPPTDKGRIRGLLDCNDGNVVLFTLRNLGPDQGLGIGTSREGGKDLTIFYHPSAEEAQRRFPQVLEEFTALRQQKRS